MRGRASLRKGSGMESSEKHTRLIVEREHAEIIIHTPKEKVNKLGRQAFLELEEHFNSLKAKAHEIKTLLIWSDKPDMFLAGADINEIESMSEESQALEVVKRAQDVFQQLAELPQVTIAAIDGPCLGGGLELSLACKYRLASDSSSTKLGLPEVTLGVIPGAGGTQRLPKVVGLVESLKMITSGAPVDAKKAMKLGLVSDVIPQEYLIEHARKVLREKTYLRYKPQESFVAWLVEVSPLKKLIFSKVRSEILKNTKGFYPAPMKALEVIERSFQGDLRQGLDLEAKAFAELAIGPVAKSLISIFFASEDLKKERGVSGMEAAQFKPSKIENLGILGAGIMGGGIAAVASQKGISVRMKDVSHESVLTGLKAARSLFDKDLKRKKINKSEYVKRLYRISPTLEFTGFKSLPFVIEAVVERMDIKKAVIQELENLIPSNAIIATNTSSLSVSEMASVCKHPERVVGMHFFNPVPKMPLVEVIRGEKTSPEVVVQTVALGRQLGKTVIVAKDRPGFLVNRVLMPFLNEAAHLRAEGYSVSQIDKAALKFGMPMGPFRLIDEVGIDTGAKVADSIAAGYPHMKVLPSLHEMVAKNYLGKKNNRGFYIYDSSGKQLGVRQEFQSNPRDPGPGTEDYLQDRLMMPMVSEAIMALDEGVVATVRDLDMGLIFGIGFPPFRGGLLRWVSLEGERKILDRLNAVHQATKGRIVVPPGLERRVSAGQKFSYS